MTPWLENHRADEHLALSHLWRSRTHITTVKDGGFSQRTETGFNFTDNSYDALLGADYTTAPANQAPNADFTYTFPSQSTAPNPAPGDEITFDASGSSDPDTGDDVVYCTWELTRPDGSTQAFVHNEVVDATPTDAGTYSMKLTVQDNDGATGTSNQSIDVMSPGNQSPDIVISVDENKRSAQQDTFFTADGSGSSDPDGNISSHLWEFVGSFHPSGQTGGSCVGSSQSGNGVPGTYSGSAQSEVLNETQTCTYQLTVTDDAAATSSWEFSIEDTCEAAAEC
jgi:hypothetical protein